METIETTVEPKREKAPRMTQAEQMRIVRLRGINNLPVNEIGAIIGRSASTVDRFLKRIDPTNQELQEFIGKEADVYSYKKLLSSKARIRVLEGLASEPDEVFSLMTPMQKAGLNRDLAVAEGIDTEKERLIRGLSTQNVAYQDMTSAEKEIEEQINKLRNSAQLTGNVIDAQVLP